MVTATQAATAALSALVVGTCGAVLLYSQNTLWPGTKTHSESQIEHMAKAEGNIEAERKSTLAPDTSAPMVGSTSSGAGSEIASASPAPQAGAGPASALSATDVHEPSFDVARVDKDGAAVIAGRAAPGAKVDLLRDGEVQDSTVADSSGQFVMTPPQLPPGSYKLTLRSTSPGGAVRQSASGVPVSLNELAALPPSVASARDNIAKPANAKPAKDRPTNEPTNKAAKGTNEAIPAALRVMPSLSSRVVSHGDSLWRISREIYGAGTGYELIFQANRNKIRNPNLIYPGQTFTLPKQR